MSSRSGLCSICGKILKNVNIIEKEIPPEYHDFVEVFDAINEVKNSTFGTKLSICSPRPAPYFRNVAKKFENKWYNVQTKFKISCPNKAHFIMSHVAEYVENSNLSLGRTSDQLIESTHQHTNKIFQRSRYFVKDVSSPAHKKGLKNGVNHYNSYNL